MADEGAVTVCVRVRPLIAREKAPGDKVSLHWKSENNTVSDVNGTKIFSYDRVFHSSDNTQQLYDGVAVPIIQSAVRGYNGTIFAYGQTASGKTYTMMGNEDSVGIIPKAIQHVFKIICESPDREFLLRVSYMEIYNETITDLLCDSRKKKPLGIREDVNRNTYVEDLIEEVVVAPEQVMEWIRKGERNRHYGETKMNEHSSRSHTIFRMIIESRERSDPANSNCDGAVMVSHLNLVDLAGSERASQTGAEGVRLKEGCNINRSLFILGQVIKKLCDDPSGFINYRDSKLTRILQNSLGGNAKTVIICTITPVSFDETLSTLQFANTAKGMKNTPKVNEVLDDDALLKRYRKEILDLKKQLEEVSSKTQIHAMEKDQLAQLLEEKNSLQKVQEDKIRNLTEMLVTSASFASKENIKTKRRRRVTWAPGKIKQANVSYFEDFEKDMPTEPKKVKMSLSALPDAEDSMLDNSEYDNQCLTVPDQTSEVEWIAGPKMTWTQKDFEESVQICEALAFEKDIAVNEVNILQAKVDNLVLENEQLKLEINEIKEKLKEKKEIDEFEVLEKQTQKDHEMQLMHEITKLKNLVSSSEACNEELEAEINSKLELLKEKENKIKILQNRVEELQKARVEKEASFSVGDSDKLMEEIQQLKKSLLDSEAIALDAKKESAFLRTENLELKEKMNELLNKHNQMQKDVQLYQSQIEGGKASYRKMQTDLQRELQSAFQENLRLTSLMEGKVPKDLLTLMELEKKAADLKGELEKALKENALLQKQVNELSEFQSLPNTVEMQKKEILEQCEELHLLKLENEKLLSEVADKEMKLKHMTEETEKSKDDLADAQLKYMKSDQEYVALKQLHEEMEQKYIATSENNEKMKLQIESLSKEAQESKITLDQIKLELSSKMKELEEKTAEQKQLLELREDFIRTQQKLNEMEQLKEEKRASELRLQAKESEIQAVLQQLTEFQEEIKTLTQEKDYLKQKGESLQAETDQLKEDIKDTVSMNILAHEELRNTQSSLKQSQATVRKLEKCISEKESHILSVEEALGKTIKELETRISQMTEEIKIITSERDQLAELKSESRSCREGDQLQEQKEQIIFLTQENRSLQEKLDSLLLKKEEFGEGTWVPQIPEKSLEQELLVLREELSQAQRKLHEMEEGKGSECQGEPEETGRRDFIPQLHDWQEVSTQTEREDDDLKLQLEDLQNERDQLRETVQETIRKNSEMQEELQCTHRSLEQHQETIVELKGNISEKENQLLKAQEALKEKTDELQQKLTEVTESLTHVSSEYGKLLAEKEQIERTMNEQVCQQLEKITVLNKEKDELQQMVEACKEREEHLLKVQRRSEILEERLTSKISQMTEEIKIITSERDQLAELKSESRSCKESDQLQEQKEQIIFLTQENRSLQEKLDSLLLKKEEFGEGTWVPQIPEKSLEQELLVLREELSQAQRKLHEMEEGKGSECQGEPEETGRRDFIPQLHDWQEVSTQTEREDNDLKLQLENLQNERDQLRETVQETIRKNSEMQEELQCTHRSLEQHQETIVELKGNISEKENQLLKAQEALKEKTDELQQKLTEVTESLTHVSSEYGKLLAEKEQIERTMNEQVCQQLEKITVLNKEKDELQQMVEACKEREEHLLKAQRQSEILEERLTSKNSEMQEELQCTHRSLGQQQETIVELKGNISEKENQLLKAQAALKGKTDELQQKLTEVTESLTHVSSEYGKLLAEKEQIERTMNEQVCQQLEKITVLNKEKDELQQMVETCKEREEHLLKVQRRSEILEDSLTSKIQQLTDTLTSVSCEKDQLLAERTSHSFQLREQIASVNQEKDELQKLLQDVRTERDQLKTELQRNSEMCAETNAKLERALDQLKQRNMNDVSVHVNPVVMAEQVADDSLKEKSLNIKELLDKFSNMGKRCECLSTVSLKLKSELNSQKALIAVILPQLSLAESKQVKRLQTENEKLNGHLQSLLNKLKFMFSRVCAKKRDYHTTVNKYKMELLEEKRRQDHLQAEIQNLRKSHLNQNETLSQELNSSEGLQSFHLDAESILKDVSEMESELLCIEAELQQQESARKETVQFWESCSATHCNAEELEEELKKDTERLLQVINFWTPKVKMLLQLSSELDARICNDSQNADVELKQRKEKNEELLQDLNTLKEKLAPDSSASLMLKEENERLHNKLKAAEQDIKAMEVKIQKLENVINEVGENVKEKDERINELQAQISIKTETSELTQLQAKLNEKDKCLRTALTENQSLQAKLDKGSELYKEEIDNLKTQLVKFDMERMKQSNFFEMKLANYKALAEHREQELMKLKEELRRAHQDQDVTVLKEAAPQQSQIPLTCGGGSGIVQSTQILVLKSEQAKIQKENLHLKKQNDLLLSNERQLKEELRKWKERALKWRERSSRENIRETIPQSPRKAVSYFFKEQIPSPSKEPISQEIATQDLSKPLPLTCPTNFFDNSSLGVLTDTCPAATQSTEEHLKHLFGTSDKDKAPDCSTQ
ncbi:centromere-associated protein E [Empidonax traillii]|uniref:centromere-associated protein E n=1 Tax=Empidonax traillii TaxID=164674 RepID=UPI000FFCE868|nr:centromere-associated protein E [Empidonax traillii]